MCLLLALWALIQVLTDGAVGWSLAAGICLGLAALTRSIAWPFAFVLIPFLALAIRATVRQRVVACVAVLIGYGLVITPWAIRNTRLQGTMTIVDTMSGINLLTGNYEYTPEDRMWEGVNLVGGPHSWIAPLIKEYPGRYFTEGEKD